MCGQKVQQQCDISIKSKPSYYGKKIAFLALSRGLTLIRISLSSVRKAGNLINPSKFSPRVSRNPLNDQKNNQMCGESRGQKRERDFDKNKAMLTKPAIRSSFGYEIPTIALK